MKKIIRVILMGVLSTLLLARTDLGSKSIKIEDKLIPFERKVKLKSIDKDPQRFEDSGAFARGDDGFSWEFNNANNKIAYNPQTQILALAHQKFESLGGMDLTYGSWGDLNTITVFDKIGVIGMDNPAVAICDNYIFAVFSNRISDVETRPYLVVYDTEEDLFCEPFEIRGTDDALGDDYSVRWPKLAVTKNDETGEYLILNTWFLPIQGYAKTKSFVLIGKSANPCGGVDSWTFSNYSDLEITMDNTEYGENENLPKRMQVNSLSPCWGTNGKGLCITAVMDTDYTGGDWTVECDNAYPTHYRTFGYITTGDYGQTWSLRDGDKYQIRSLDSEDMSFYHNKTETFVEMGDTLTIAVDKITISWNIDATVTDENDLFIYCNSCVFSHCFERIPFLDDGTIGGGYAVFRAKLDSDSLDWQGSSFVSIDSKLTCEMMGTGEGWNKYDNGFCLSIGKMKAENGKTAIYAIHTDRPFGNDAVENNFDAKYSNYYGEVYASISQDGINWTTKNWAAEVFGENYDPEKDPPMPASIRITNSPEVNKSASEAAPLAFWNGEELEESELTIFTAYQTNDPIHTNYESPSNTSQFEQEYHLLKIDQNDLKMPTTSLTENDELLVRDFELAQNYPNPFNPVTIIKFSLKKDSKVKLTIYNSLGEEIVNLVDENLKAGLYKTEFKATNFNSGVYFYKLDVEGASLTKKMILIK